MAGKQKNGSWHELKIQERLLMLWMVCVCPMGVLYAVCVMPHGRFIWSVYAPWAFYMPIWPLIGLPDLAGDLAASGPVLQSELAVLFCFVLFCFLFLFLFLSEGGCG